MRILYVIDSLANGGAERSLAAMVPHYADHDLDLEVVALARRSGVHDFVAEQVPVHVVERRGRRASAAAIRSLVLQRAPDVVHSTLFEADLAVRLGTPIGGPPIVTSLVNDSYGPAQRSQSDVARWKLEAARWVDAISARRVRRFHAISTHVAVGVGARLRLPADRIEVIPRGRDARVLGSRTVDRRRTARASLGLAEGDYLVLAAARHERQKGLDVLLAAAPAVRAACPTVRFAVAGREGAASASLQEQAATAGAELLGDRDDVSELLCAADVFVLPSRWEGAGSVLLEAMALGCPVVASDLPAVREVLGETAYLVPPDRPMDLADALVGVFLRPSIAAARSMEGIRRFHHLFAVDAVVAQLAAFYERSVR